MTPVLFVFATTFFGALWLTFTGRVRIPLGIALMVLSYLLALPLAWLLGVAVSLLL